MKITVIIPTYSNRYQYVKTVVDFLLTQQIHKIIIVNNNSSVESTAQLNLLQSSFENIEVINLNRNTGSAFAFNRGIEKVIEDPASEFIWLLDDDNLPEEDALEILLKAARNDRIMRNVRDTALASCRVSKNNYIEAARNNEPENIIGIPDIFRSFHIRKILFPKRRRNNNSWTNTIPGLFEISAVPYGGMFFHKDLITKTGYADEKYVLYCDDFDFCSRVINSGGKIYLIPQSRINDIEKSWNVKEKAIVSIAKGKSDFRVYYSVRNRVYLEKKYLVTSWPVYILNMLIYSAIVTGIALVNFKFKNIRTYYTALYHGLTGKMGYNEKYSLE